MKSLSSLLHRSLLLLAVFISTAALSALATDVKTKPAKPAPKTPTKPAKAAAPAPTNAAPVQVEIPKSVFVVPTSPQQGKDPFFPLSKRLFAAVVVPIKGNAPSATIVDLKLKGLAGTPDHPLAIINNRTFEANEEGSISTSTGRVTVRCVAIKPDSVVVFVNGQERILHLRPGS
jgi:hypothetical protein